MKTGRGFRPWTEDQAQSVRERLIDQLAEAVQGNSAAGR
jgi:hypothetical protein